MNRRSLFGRLTASVSARGVSQGHDYFRVHLEPLEQRQLLTTSPVWVNDNWVNLTNPGFAPAFGDLVTNSNDTIDTGTITKLYGIDAFGATVDGTGAGMGLIHDAIQGTDTTAGTLNLLEGTYVESDVVIDRPLVFQGAGDTGPARSLIVPEVTSSHSDITNFGTGTHQVIIIYSGGVTVSAVAVDGNGNGSLAGTLNYHHGITTLYDLQNGADYSSLHNGTLPLIQLGTIVTANRSRPNVLIDNVTAENLFYHGISYSALAGKQFGQDAVESLSVDNAVVNNVGDVGNQDTSRIGILIQGLDNNPFDAPNNGNVRFSSVTNAGVGIESNALGPGKTYASQAGSRNLTGMVFNTVTDAVTEAYHIEFNDGSQSYISNVANFSPGNNATGVYINHSRIAANSFVINGAKIGVHIQNNSESAIGGDDIPTLFLANVLTGPGTGVAGSIGVLVDNSASETDSSTVSLASNTQITGYEIGVRAVQNFTPGDSLRTRVVLADPIFGTLGTGISLGDGVTLSGSDPSPSLVTTGSASIEPGFSQWNNYYYYSPGNSTGTDIIQPDAKADILNNGNTTLSSGATFAPLITGESGTTGLFNFNAAVNYPFSAPPDAPANGVTPTPYGVLFNWFGNVTQNGNGEFIIGGTATNGHGLDYAFGANNTPLGGGLYQLEPTDISNRTTLNIVAKLGAANQAQMFAIGIFDIRGNANLWAFSSDLLNSSTFTTLTVNLLAPSINLIGPDDHMDLTKICGYVYGNDEGTINGNQEVPFGLIVDDISTASLANSKVNVTGTVNLGGATLGATIRPSFTPTLTQQFTIIDNDGVDAVTGTFAGQAEGSYVTISGNTYKVSYTGGTGNDVVLTRENIATNSSVVGRRLFYNQSGTASPLRYDGNNAAINANDDLAIATDKTAYLPGSGAATFANVSSFTKGINGIMVDIAGAHGTITAADFIFRVGNNNTPNSWVAGPAPNSISVRAGAGTSGSDRVVLTWANGAISKKWLEVIVLANANTGLAQKVGYPVGQGDVFFFGNALADSGSGDTATQANVNATDELAARNNPASVLSNIPITNLFDYNRDGAVNTTDALASRNNATGIGNVTRFISVANPPAAPEASPASDDGAVASALSAPSVGGALASAGVPRWLVNRLQNADLNSGPIARFFEHLAEQNTPGTRRILVAADKVADDLGLDHELLDSLLADLGLE